MSIEFEQCAGLPDEVDQIIGFAILIFAINPLTCYMYAISTKMKHDLVCLNVTRIVLCLCLGLLGTGCMSQSLVMKADNAAHESSPVVNTAHDPSPVVTTADDPSPVFNAADDPSPMFNAALCEKADAAKEMADWVVRSRDNQNMPFAIIDKVKARVYVYDVDGKPQGEAPVLLGLAKGDYSTPGIGDKPLSHIPPAERITPAGRFVARMGRNHKGKEILWVDYAQSLSLHPVIKGVPRDRRAQRLASATPLDNRISFGCINVPKRFFEDVIHRKFSGTAGVVYILPETKGFRKL